ncbi:MAG TPA: hypothetical protein VER17_17845 [Tepidisphaeraceae bacterium]|nr:hypothetical protein [Tepidisphaeraceae bacterium]
MTADPAQHLDLAILRPDALSAEVHRAATFAMHHGVGRLVAAPAWTARLVTLLRGSGVRVVSAVGYPFGSGKSTVKAIEATSTLKDGADAIEVVPHHAYLLGLDLDGARAELMEIVRAARATRRDAAIAATIEVDLLVPLDAGRRLRCLEVACRAARESGCDGLVLGTGLRPASRDAVTESLALFRPLAHDLTLKALPAEASHAVAALAAGADRVGVVESPTLKTEIQAMRQTEVTR